MAFLFNLKALVDMMSIGTLLAYSLVAACVLILRYQPDVSFMKAGCNGEKEALSSDESELTESESHLNMLKEGGSTLQCVLHPPLVPTEQSSSVVNMAVSLLVVAVCVISTLTTHQVYALLALEAWVLAALSVSLLVFIGCVVLICRQPQTSRKVSFMVPCIPFLPILSIFVNVYLMVQLSGDTWVRFSLWMAVGFVIYFGYGMWHSVERQRQIQASLCRSTQEKTKPKGEKVKEKEGAVDQERFILPEKTSQC